jgi:hypothetical protein
MPLNANALVTLSAAKAFIQPGGMTPGDDAALEEVINRASALIERWCRRPLAKATANVRLRGPSGTDLFLLHTPIAASQNITVTVWGEALTVWRSDADGDPTTYDVVLMRSCEDPVFTPDVLYRAGTWNPSASFSPVPALRVTYTGGWVLEPEPGLPMIPADLEEAALEVVKKLWTDQSKGVQDLTTVNMSGGGFTIFDAAMPRRATMLLEPFRSGRMVA